MRKVLIALSLFAFSLPVSVHAAPKKSAECADCEAYQKGVHREVIPTRDVVCIFFVQSDKDNVVLSLSLKSGEERKYYRKDAGTSGRICVGRHWIRSTKTMKICNGTAHADYLPEHVAVVEKKETLSREAEACLSGKAKCKELGYQTR